MLKLTPDEAMLLRAVAADLDSDLPRLVYADFLDDHGRPERAEFIRLQCRLAAAQPSERVALRNATNSLLDRHQAAWDRDLPKWATEAMARPTYTRGFIEDISAQTASYVRYAPQLLDRTPLRHANLSYPGRVWDEVVRCCWLGEVPHVWFTDGELTDRQAAELASRAGWLAQTRGLELTGFGLRDPAARALAGCRHLTGLRRLVLRGNQLTRTGVEALLASPHLIKCRFELAENPRLDADPHAVRRLLGPRGTL